MKKLIGSKKQEIATLNENDTVGKENKNDNLPVAVAPPALPESDRIKKLKELIQNKKQAKITTNLDKKPTNTQNDEKNKESPVKINLPINVAKNKKGDAENPTAIGTDITQNQEQLKNGSKLSLIERLKLKKATVGASDKMGDEPLLNRTEMLLERRRKLREQLKERLLAARNRNKAPEAM